MLPAFRIQSDKSCTGFHCSLTWIYTPFLLVNGLSETRKNKKRPSLTASYSQGRAIARGATLIHGIDPEKRNCRALFEIRMISLASDVCLDVAALTAPSAGHWMRCIHPALSIPDSLWGIHTVSLRFISLSRLYHSHLVLSSTILYFCLLNFAEKRKLH